MIVALMTSMKRAHEHVRNSNQRTIESFLERVLNLYFDEVREGVGEKFSLRARRGRGQKIL
jgi:hypothetical protein